MKYFTFQIRESPKLKVLSGWLFVLVLLSTMTAVLVLNHNNDGKKLELVQVIFRHGERTPTEREYSRVPYVPPSVYKPYGFGQLTNNGRMQAYKLGLMLRERYANYLDDVYHAEDLYAHSSDSERTMTTLQLVLAGLYPPTSIFQWNSALNWQPIPYFYTPEKFDVLLKPMLGKTFVEIMRRETDPVINATNVNDYSDVIKIIEEQFGKSTQYTNLDWLAEVYNVFHSNVGLSIDLPDWCTPEVLVRLKEYFVFETDWFSYTLELKRMHGGPLIKQFIDNMNVNETVDNPRKMYLYSGHDLNIGAVVRSLGLKDFWFADYSSAIIVEKLRDIDNQVYIRMVGRRGPDDEFETLKIGNCSELCPIKEFLRIAENVIPTDEEMHHLERDFRGSMTEDIFLHDPYIKKR